MGSQGRGRASREGFMRVLRWRLEATAKGNGGEWGLQQAKKGVNFNLVPTCYFLPVLSP